MRDHVATGPVVNLWEVRRMGAGAYLEQHPIQSDSYVSCDFDPDNMFDQGEALALLRQLAEKSAQNITGLDLDYAELMDDELLILPSLFPKLLRVSLGFEIGPEALGSFVEAFPQLQYLGVRKLGKNSYSDAFFERLVTATQRGALQELVTLFVLQTEAHPEALEMFFKKLPRLRNLAFSGVRLDPHTQMLVQAFVNGPLKNLQEFSIGRATQLSKENQAKLLRACPGSSVRLDDFIDEMERAEVLQSVIEEGSLDHVTHICLNNNTNIPPSSLARMLGRLPGVSVIELDNMDLTDRHMLMLAKELQAGRLTGVQSLKMKDNPKLTIPAVAEVAKHLKNLIHLSMNNMTLNDEAAKIFAKGLSTLVTLNLSGSSVSPEVLAYLVYQNQKLKHLDLSGTELTDEHLQALVHVLVLGGLSELESLTLGGKQNFTGIGFGDFAMALPGTLISIGFYDGVHAYATKLNKEHVRAIYQATLHGKLTTIRRLSFDLIGGLAIDAEVINLIAMLVINMPNLEGLGFYAIANNHLLDRLILEKNRGKLPNLKGVNIMECHICARTIGALHIAFPEQPLHYFECGFGDDHADALIAASKTLVRGGPHPLRSFTYFNAINNPWSGRKLAELFENLPGLIGVNLNGQDMKTEKLLAIANVRRNGHLQNVTSFNLQPRGTIFTPESLVEFLEAFEGLVSVGIGMTLTDEHLVKLVEAVERGALRRVTSFGVSGDGTLSSKALVRLFSNMPNLKSLGVQKCIADAHIAEFLIQARQGRWPHLQEFNLSNNDKITDAGNLLRLLIALHDNSPEFKKITMEDMKSFKEVQWTLILDCVKFGRT